MHGCFVVEGLRSVEAFLDAGHKVRYLVVTTTFMLRLPACMTPYMGILRVVTPLVMQGLSGLESSSDVLLVASLQDLPLIEPKPNQRILVLDDVKDPGNMGTIIRVAHWYGIQHVVVSRTTVDCYNPKVVQASMGALSWVRVYYTDLRSFLAQQWEKGIPTIGCVLDGVNMYKQAIPNGCVVLGNEAKGIRKAFISIFITQDYDSGGWVCRFS